MIENVTLLQYCRFNYVIFDSDCFCLCIFNYIATLLVVYSFVWLAKIHLRILIYLSAKTAT